MQFLNKLFADCVYWHIDKAVDVPAFIFINFGIQFGRANAVFFTSNSPLDDDDEGLGDDDDQ